MFLRSNLSFPIYKLLERLKRDFDGDRLRSFLFKFTKLDFYGSSYRFLISTCYFAHLDGLSAENMIPDF